MLSLSNVKAAQAENYYERDDYYTRGDEAGDVELQADSQWQGKGAASLHLTGEVDKQSFQQLLRGHTPNGKKLRSRPIDSTKHRAATDYTFSAPKSVSIAALIQKDMRVVAAHDAAVKVALEVLESRYAQTRVRRGPGIRERVQTSNIIAATFRHETSREQDPQLHTHCVVINATQLANGKWQSLANEDVLNNQKLLGEIYQNELAHNLRKLGYGIEAKENGVFECSEYTEPLLNLFSTRTQQIEAYIERWESALKEKRGKPLNAKQKEQATLATRLRKKAVPRTVLLDGWEKAISKSEIQLPDIPAAAASEVENGAVVAATAGVSHAAERESVFKREKAERFALEHHLGEQSFAQLQSAMTDAGLIAAKHRHTTQAAIERERETIELMKNGQGQESAIAPATEVLQLTATEQTLTTGQYKAILDTATSTNQFIAWQGVAGAGKTYSLKLLTQLAAANGYVVSGYAPSAEAASVLAAEANIEGATVARLLHSKAQRNQAGDRVSTQANKPLWIVDEAGLLSAKDAHALLTKAQQQNARVILVGDTKQLSAVEAGNPFKSLQVAGIQICYLQESRRQKTAELRAAAVCLAAGETQEGIDRLERFGMVQEVPDAAQRQERIVMDYLSLTPEQREQTLILAGTNAERLALTQSIRSVLQQTGSLGADTSQMRSLRQLDRTAAQKQYVSSYDVGNVVVTVKDYRRYGMERRVPYRVVERDLANNRLTLAAPDGRTFSFDPATCAMKTTYAVQELAIAPGDKLRWTRNEAVPGVRNGQQVTVEAIRADGVATLRTDKGELIEANLNGQQYLDYALANTTYSAQGKTADIVLVSADSTLSKESFNVAVTRARYRLSLYSSDVAELRRRAERSSAKENPSEYLPLFKLVKEDAQNKEVDRPRELRSLDRAESAGVDTGAVVASSYEAALRRDSAAKRTAGSISQSHRADAAESRRSLAAASREVERTVAKQRREKEQPLQQLQEQEAQRSGPSGVYEAHVAHLQEQAQRGEERASRALARLNRLIAEQAAAQQRSEQPDNSEEQQRYYDLYYQFANEVGGGVDVQAQDRQVAKRLIGKMLRARKGQPLTQEDKVLAESIMQQSPEAKRLAKEAGSEAAQSYAVSILRQANQRIMAERARQMRRAQQKEQGGMER